MKTEGDLLAELQGLLVRLPLGASVRQLRLLAAPLVQLAQVHPGNARAIRFDDLIEAWADMPGRYDEDFFATVRHTRSGESWQFGHILRDAPPERLVQDIRKLFAFFPGIPVEKGVTLVRDVMGHVLGPVTFDPSWRTEAVMGLARGIYESRDFAPMPVLADALEDAGCAAPDILAHCRGPGPHVRGCWVVDLVLGKA